MAMKEACKGRCAGLRRFVVLVSGTLVYGKGDAVEVESHYADLAASDLEGLPPPAPITGGNIFPLLPCLLISSMHQS